MSLKLLGNLKNPFSREARICSEDKEEQMNQKNKMGVMPMGRLVITMSLPIMISMLVQSLYNIVDSIFVAKLSESALTATSISYSAQMLQIAVAVGTGVGVNAIVSRFLGAQDNERANEAATTGWILTVASSLIFVLWGLAATEPFIRLFTEEEEIVRYGTGYLRICQVFSTGIFLGTFYQRLLQATGRTFSSMLAQMAGAVVNLILDPLLIFGIGFFPELGISGAAIATVIGQWAAALIGFLLNVVQNKEIHFVLHGYRMNKETVKLIYKVGAPTILMQAFGSIMVSAMNMLLVVYSSTAVAFFGVYYKLQSFLFMPMNGLGQGTLPVVGFNLGAKKYDRIRQACKVSIGAGCSLGLIGTFIFCIFAEKLLGLFSAGDAMLAMGVPALRVIAVTFVLASATMIIGYIISGMGNGTVNMAATALRQIIILIPGVYLFGRTMGLGTVWYAFWIAEAAACIFAVFCMKSRLKALEQSAEEK